MAYPNMPSTRYSAAFDNVTLTTVTTDLMEFGNDGINPGLGYCLAIYLGAFQLDSGAGDAGAEFMRLEITRFTPGTPATATVVTSQPLNPGDPASNFIVKRVASTESSLGTFDRLWSGVWDLRLPLKIRPAEKWLWPISGNDKLILRNITVASASLNLSGSLVYEERNF